MAKDKATKAKAKGTSKPAATKAKPAAKANNKAKPAKANNKAKPAKANNKAKPAATAKPAKANNKATAATSAPKANSHAATVATPGSKTNKAATAATPASKTNKAATAATPASKTNKAATAATPAPKAATAATPASKATDAPPAAAPGRAVAVGGAGTVAKPWRLTTPPGSSAFLAYRDDAADPPALVCKVGSTTLSYQLRCIDDLHAMLKAHGDWMALGGTDEQKPAPDNTVEAWGRATTNPVGGWYGLKKGFRGRFGVYVPPVLEALGLAEVEHGARNNRMRAK